MVELFLYPSLFEEAKRDPAWPGVQAEDKGSEGQPLWAYRYRVEGRGSSAAAGGWLRDAR